MGMYHTKEYVFRAFLVWNRVKAVTMLVWFEIG